MSGVLRWLSCAFMPALAEGSLSSCASSSAEGLDSRHKLRICIPRAVAELVSGTELALSLRTISVWEDSGAARGATAGPDMGSSAECRCADEHGRNYFRRRTFAPPKEARMSHLHPCLPASPRGVSRRQAGSSDRRRALHHSSGATHVLLAAPPPPRSHHDSHRHRQSSQNDLSIFLCIRNKKAPLLSCDKRS